VHLMQAGEIAQRLADRAEDICRELLPHGKREGHEWRAGSVSGEPGKRLGVHLTGPEAGAWADFAAGGGGDLMDLWRVVRRVDLPEAMRQACSHLGIAEPTFVSGRAPAVKAVKGPAFAEVRDRVSAWMEERGISIAAQDAYRLGSRGHELVLPYYRDGDLVAV